VPGLAELMTVAATVDLFEPPRRERIRAAAAALSADGLDQRAVARRLGTSQAAVQKALALNAQMAAAGLATPYAVLTGPPADYPKLRRHRNPKYRFEPPDGHRPPAS
jgi:hypothetical protein